ncbi:MAG: hopanoid biosynthesis-associated protein HpnK [Chloracidobacterium sp.]|nr:hopanoid biosynthesis-associated protein HpnK [Chloracidobacterium sp.]MDW8218663.1 hopanoid biosynthesis-associated protein HpnK [Acidobacteriota bacterium]
MSTRLVIINADDFGASPTVNQAVAKAYDEGVLTSCSLMVGGDAFDEAVALAKARPGLAVGLHLTLVCGKSVLPAAKIPHLVDVQRQFSSNPVTAGLRYFLNPHCQEELRREIRAQFERFMATGLPCSHVDGHLHFHLHPTVFPILADCAAAFGVRFVRLPRERLRRNLAIRRQGWPVKLLHWAIFGWLSHKASRRMTCLGLRCADEVHGLYETGRFTEDYWLALLDRLGAEALSVAEGAPTLTHEIYCHPEAPSPMLPAHNAHGPDELAALLSPAVRARLRRANFRPATYADLL